MRKTRGGWEIKKLIWKRWMLGDTDEMICQLLAKQLALGIIDEKTAIPYHPDTVRKVRNQLLKADVGEIQQLLIEEPIMKSFVLQKRPDLATQLAQLEPILSDPGDEQILASMARLFDRPAFTDEFSRESSMEAFKQAITDTIAALNTGIHRDTDNRLIERIPSKHKLKDIALRNAVDGIDKNLRSLRDEYDTRVRRGEIKLGKSYVPGVSWYDMTPEALDVMNAKRAEILISLADIYPEFQTKLPPYAVNRSFLKELRGRLGTTDS